MAAPPPVASDRNHSQTPRSRARRERLVAIAAEQACDPVTKLRFLRAVSNRQDKLPVASQLRLCDAWVRSWFHIARLPRDHAPGNSQRAIAIFLFFSAIALIAYALIQSTSAAQPARVVVREMPPPQSLPIVAAKPAQSIVAEALPEDALGITPTTIWLADRGETWELYSNGLRIETQYAVKGEPRVYKLHDRDLGQQPALFNKPVGILFHTTESDMWELDSSNAKQLRQSSAALLKYVQRQRAYNYVIDRFGRVYRIVDDETRAHHAGHSIWAHGRSVYLDLNNSFVGVSFESRWEGAQSLPITRAQLVAGRNLTHYLRQRFAIAPELCVTHGLTSVSPKQYLIGYHKDWARGFPFAAFGLPDQYAIAPPSIAMFGFSYEDDLVRAVGDGWPGAFAAETALAKEALDSGVDIATLRAERRALFTKWAGEARRVANPSNPILATR